MSPFTTLKICGISSMLKRRSHAAQARDARVFLDLEHRPRVLVLLVEVTAEHARPHRSSSGTCSISKVRPPRPMRSWRKKTGPGESSLISTATTARTGRQQEHEGAAHHQVERALHGHVEAAQLDVADVEQRDALDVVDAGARAHDLEEARHDVDLDAVVGAQAHKLQELRVTRPARRRRSRGRASSRLMIASRSASVPSTGTSGPLPLGRGSPSSMKPDDVEPVLRVVGDLGGQQCGRHRRRRRSGCARRTRPATTRSPARPSASSGTSTTRPQPEGDERRDGRRRAAHEHHRQEDQPARRSQSGQTVQRLERGGAADAASRLAVEAEDVEHGDPHRCQCKEKPETRYRRAGEGARAGALRAGRRRGRRPPTRRRRRSAQARRRRPPSVATWRSQRGAPTLGRLRPCPGSATRRQFVVQRAFAHVDCIGNVRAGTSSSGWARASNSAHRPCWSRRPS